MGVPECKQCIKNPEAITPKLIIKSLEVKIILAFI
jgi:hypothetical protein